METSLPPAVRPVLEQYVERLEQILPGFVQACYLHGSLALGAFNQRYSDIDFITIIGQVAGRKEMDGLKLIHRELKQRYPQWPLEGCYVQWGDLGRPEGEIEPYPCYYQGTVHPRGHHGLNAVTWWVLKHHGVAVAAGPSPQRLDFAVDWDLLIAQMRENLNTYWAKWAAAPIQWMKLLTDWGIQCAVLGVLRQFYTFREDAITSKTGAGDYALAHLPAEWHGIIHEAIRIRENTGRPRYRLRTARAVEAVKLLKYIIEACNEMC